jgi:hypothetical protein
VGFVNLNYKTISEAGGFTICTMEKNIKYLGLEQLLRQYNLALLLTKSIFKGSK